MNLTESEEKVFGLLLSNEKVPREAIQKVMNCTSHSAIVRMKYLSAKVAPYGWIIENISGIGPSRHAVFTMRKMF